MDEPVFISICIPAYRRANDLRRLLDSIAGQTYRHFEVVITDDSPDEEVANLVGTHPLRAMINYSKNRQPLGTPENWNESVRRAKGEWIKLMHDDDWFSVPESLHEFAAETINTAARFYFSSYENIFPDGRTKQVSANARFLRSLRKSPQVLFAANRIGPPSAVLFKNDPEIVFDNRLKWLVDIDFYYRYLKANPGAVFIARPLVCIGISESQVTQSSFRNPEVEIPEQFMLWEKMTSGSIKSLRIYDSWWRFVRNLNIHNMSDIRTAGYWGDVPGFVQSIIKWQRHLPKSLLKKGVVSKIFMTLHYVFG